MDLLYLTFMVLTGVAFALGAFFFSRLIAPRQPDPVKVMPYECGELTHGSTWMRFNVGYYIFALLFLVFEVEVLFFFPWAVVLKEVGVVALVEGGIFLGILLFGFAFAWRKGCLVWH